jgi:uncharacterized membrane protein
VNTLILALRTIHIFAGVLWVGSAIFYLLFVEPTVRTLGPAGPKFMQGLLEGRRYPLYMNLVSVLTVLAGGALYWFSSGGLQVAWLKSGPGIGFTLGSVVALGVWLLGFFMIRPRADRMGALGKEIGRAGGPPSAAQAAEMHKLSHELTSIERVDAILLTVALVAMATARYWSF